MRWLAGLLGGGILERILDTVDRKVQSQTDRDKLKADIVMEAYRSRAGFMRAGGFVLMLLFAVPVAFWFAAICLYNVLWHRNGIWPQDWTIAAMPPPLDEWGWAIMLASMGLTAVFTRK